MVDHKSGNEDDGRKSNLQWLCRSCNAKKGYLMSKRGTGRRTRQYNPKKAVPTLAQYAHAVSTHRKRTHDEGGKVIHATPPAKRSEYAREMWGFRKAHGNPKRIAAKKNFFGWSKKERTAKAKRHSGGATEARTAGYKFATHKSDENLTEWMDRKDFGNEKSAVKQRLAAAFYSGYERGKKEQDRKERIDEAEANAKIRAAERRIEAAEKKIEVAEKKVEKGGRGGMSEAQFEAIKARMQREIEKQEEVKRRAQNPAWGYGVYSPAEPGIFGADQLAHFGSRAAAETWARSRGLSDYRIRRSFDKTKNPDSFAQTVYDAAQVPGQAVAIPVKRFARQFGVRTNPAPESSTEYRLGYNLGQTDRQTAAMQRTLGELHATFGANFGAAPSPDWEAFEAGYAAGYSGQMGAAAPNPGVYDAQDVKREGYQAGRELFSRTGVDPKRINRPEVAKQFAIWWNHGGKDLSGVSKATAQQSFINGWKGHYGTNNPHALSNPETEDSEYDQALKIASLFHGRPVKEEITVTESIREHDWLWRIGPLVKLKVKLVTKQRATFPFPAQGPAMVHLMCSPDGRQLYLRDGDQELDLEALGMEEGTKWYRDRMVIGEIKEITYRDRKKFYQFKEIDFFHLFGEETKVKPWLLYDTMNKHLEILGGQYHVETEDLVEQMSPGLVN